MSTKIKIGIAIYLLIALFIGIFVYRDTKDDQKRYDAQMEYVGKRVVIEKDTLVVTRYMGGYYILSNRTELDVKLIDRFLLKE